MRESSVRPTQEDKQPFWLRKLSGAVRSPLEASSLQVLVAPQIPNLKHHWLPSIAAFPMWCPIFFTPACNLDTAFSCDPPTSSQTSLTPSKFQRLCVHRLKPDLVRQVVVILLQHLLLPHALVHLQRHPIHTSESSLGCYHHYYLLHCLPSELQVHRAWSKEYSYP